MRRHRVYPQLTHVDEHGYSFLHKLLAAGNSISVPAKPYVGLLAPPVQLALASTLIVHPPDTTKTHSTERLKGSDAALRYLRCVHNTIEGPAYKSVRRAFTFPEKSIRRRAPAQRAGTLTPSPTAAGNDIDRLGTEAANSQSIWQRAEDFWHVVGWALNCSILHKKRWERWKLWLDITLDFIEADWEECLRQCQLGLTERDGTLEDSLLWQYISEHGRQEPNIGGTRRRIVKAILAAGDAKSLEQFPEIWVKETEGPKVQNNDKSYVGTVNFETGELGDYASDIEDDIMYDAPRASTRRKIKDVTDASLPPLDNSAIPDYESAVERLGGMEAVLLRQRLIALLVQAATHLPNQFTGLSGLFDNLTEHFNHLPVSMLSVLITTSQLSNYDQLTFNVDLIIPLSSGQYPDYTKTIPVQEHFEQILLPNRAPTQSFAANAKLSIVLEQMFLYMMKEKLFKPTDNLRAAVEKGIEERHKVFGTARGKKRNAEEEKHGQLLMEASSERLLSLLEILEISAGKAPRPRSEKKSILLSSFTSSLSSLPQSGTEDDAD